MIGIYKFENLVNGKKYIGQSINIERRYKDHIVRAKNNFPSNSEYNSAFHKALRKYGISSFSFEILEECGKAQLNQKEIYWIKYFDSYANGYNETSGGEAQEASVKFDEEFVKNISGKVDINATNVDVRGLELKPIYDDLTIRSQGDGLKEFVISHIGLGETLFERVSGRVV